MYDYDYTDNKVLLIYKIVSSSMPILPKSKQII